MEDNEVVKIDELKNVANDFKIRKNNILDIYNKRIKNILIQSELCIRQSGGDYEEISKTYSDLFSKFDNNMTELELILVNRIIPNYENLASDIKGIFNNNFKSELEDLLEIEENNGGN